FGQGISVTLLQLANAFATIADGGVWRAPFWDQDQKPSLARQVIRAETAEKLVRMLEASVSDRGTGALARVVDWRVAGKTGTPQRVAPGGGYAENRFDGVFVGFAPVDDPEIVVAVRVEDPQQHKAGGTAAAPVFAEVVQASLPYLGRPPEETGIALAAFPGQSARNWPGPGWSLRAARRMARKAGATLLAHGHGWAVRARPLSPQRGKRWEVWFAEAAW
ncbi:MAG: peptidoglycan glycosyltransferase, partial [Zetaproteobacteria bacterium]